MPISYFTKKLSSARGGPFAVPKNPVHTLSSSWFCFSGCFLAVDHSQKNCRVTKRKPCFIRPRALFRSLFFSFYITLNSFLVCPFFKTRFTIFFITSPLFYIKKQQIYYKHHKNRSKELNFESEVDLTLNKTSVAEKKKITQTLSFPRF